jgi:hypothetical protein
MFNAYGCAMRKRFLLSFAGAALLPLLLVACNGGEDFSDADIGGPVIEPSPGSGTPLGSDVETIEVEFVDDRVLGLGYECQGAGGGTGYTGYVINDNTNQFDDEFEGEQVPDVVECEKEATAVNFFLGGIDTERFSLGTVFLPQEAKRERYQVAPTDIVASPARIEADQTGNEEQKRAFYIAALLQGLDGDARDNGIINVPLAAHQTILNDTGDEDTPTASAEGLSAYKSYSEFEDAWRQWFAAVDGRTNDNIALPGNASAVSTKLGEGLNRLRSGTYTLESALFGRKVVEADDQDDIDNFLAPLLVQIPVLVYPDGVVQGVGYVADIGGSLGDVDRSNTTLAAVSSGSELSTTLQLSSDNPDAGLQVSGLLEENVNLELTGRFLGSNLYYDLNGPLTQSSDYRADYSQGGVYEPIANDRGFYSGEAFGTVLRDDGQLLNGFKSGFVAVDYDTDKLPKSGSTGDTAPQFYRLTPYKPCSGSDAYDDECSDFEANEPEPGNNYPETVADDDGENEIEVTEEQPKPATFPGSDSPASQQSFNVEIRDGYVYTDLNGDCTATSEQAGQYKDANGSQEYRVGFVTRTDEGGGAENLPPSMNLIIHMTVPGLSEEIPHYGLRTSGRIDLSASKKPFYRTGDGNFDQGIRARWVDQAGPSGFAFELFRRGLEGQGDLQGFEERESSTRFSGALEGQKATSANGACPP